MEVYQVNVGLNLQENAVKIKVEDWKELNVDAIQGNINLEWIFTAGQLEEPITNKMSLDFDLDSDWDKA